MNLGLKHVNEIQTRNLLILRVTPPIQLFHSPKTIPQTYIHTLRSLVEPDSSKIYIVSLSLQNFQ